jgi:hypothetical protein
MEDKLENLKITRLGFGEGVVRKYHQVGRGPFPGYENDRQEQTGPLERVLKQGFSNSSPPKR